MKTAYPETMTFPAGLATAPELSGLIDETIKSFTESWQLLQMPVALQFPQELEAVYETETRQARVRELRLMCSTAVFFLFVTTVMDPLFVPDLGWKGLQLRLLASLVMALGILSYDRLSAGKRELSACATAYLVIVVLARISCLSHAIWAPYGLFVCTLAIMYTLTTIPLRFKYAWPYTAVCSVSIACMMFLDRGLDAHLAYALIFLNLVGVSFSLIANYRMERALRLGYLLASKEALRLFALNRDRDELAMISNTDALTGVANRGHFDRRLAELFDGSVEAGTEIHLIMLDVDFFKRYNDRYGHPAGDACLRSIAALLSHAVRGKKDFAFRYGGEEFGALLMETSKAQVEKIAERIRSSVQQAAIAHQNRQDGLNVVTVSVGVAFAVVGDGASPESLIERADRVLYASKNAGRNRVSFSTETRGRSAENFGQGC